MPIEGVTDDRVAWFLGEAIEVGAVLAAAAAAACGVAALLGSLSPFPGVPPGVEVDAIASLVAIAL